MMAFDIPVADPDCRFCSGEGVERSWPGGTLQENVCQCVLDGKMTPQYFRRLAEAVNASDPTFYDDCGTYTPRIIAEDLAWNHGDEAWLDDENHWIWALANDLAAKWEKERDETAD